LAPVSSAGYGLGSMRAHPALELKPLHAVAQAAATVTGTTVTSA
jgi:hypothetical protein